MSRIDVLIAEYCPNGVEYKPLGVIADFERGSAMTVRSAIPGPYRLVANGPEPIATHSESNRDGEFVVVARSGAYAGTVSHWQGPLFLTDAFSVHPHLGTMLTRFAYYLLQSQQAALLDMKAGGGVPHVRVREIEAFRVPVPPIGVQRAIVDVLDRFAELEAELEGELEGELEARRRQYEYYRDALLAFHDRPEIRWVPIGDLGTWIGGITPSKAQSGYWEDGTIPWVASMDVSATNGREIRGRVTQRALQETPLRLVPAPSVAVVMRSNILRRFLPVGLIEVDATANQDMRLLKAAEGINPRFIYQALLARAESIRTTCVRTDGSMAAVDSKAFCAYSIPVPSLAEQERIVVTLDKFDALVNDLSVGLPAELKARRQQYEHYRDRLLTFPELA